MYTGLPGLGLSHQHHAGGGGAYDPMAQFAAGAKGFMLDWQNYATMFQDTAGTTPVTTNGQIISRINDQSGRANNFTQGTAGKQPTTATLSGVKCCASLFANLGVVTGTLTAGTFNTDMDFFIAMMRSTLHTNAEIFNSTPQSASLYYDSNGGAATAVSGMGTASALLVDGVAVPGGTGATQVSLEAAITASVWHVVEAHDLNMSTLTVIELLSTASGFGTLDGWCAFVICAQAGSTQTRASNRTYVGAKVGLVL